MLRSISLTFISILFAASVSFFQSEDTNTPATFADFQTAVEKGITKEVARFLKEFNVDPSYNDHQLILESKFVFGARTTMLLMLDHRFDPSAHDNKFLKAVFTHGERQQVVALLLAHPKIDPHSIVKFTEVNDQNPTFNQEMIILLNGRHVTIREGGTIEHYVGLNVDALVTLLHTSILHGKVEVAKICCSILSDFKISKPFELALCFDQVEIGRLGLAVDRKFARKLSDPIYLDETIRRLQSWKASKSLDLILELIMSKDETLKQLIECLCNPKTIEVENSALAVYSHSLNVYSKDTLLHTRLFIIYAASSALFKHYAVLFFDLPDDLIQLILKHSI